MKGDAIKHPAAAHAVPFAVWIAVLFLLDGPALSPAWAYALRTGLGLAALLWFRPWRWYEPFRLRHVPLAVGVGVLVTAIWVAGESRWVPDPLREAYVKWAVLPLGKGREPLAALPYAPEVCGWPLTLVRLAGSAFVISFIEEFFFRGFLYRWMQGANFTQRDLGIFDPRVFLVVALVFGLEHPEWAAGIAAGLAYGWLAVHTRDIWAAGLAHAVTNLLLGLYVLATGSWQFW
jgi:hypothetical protein